MCGEIDRHRPSLTRNRRTLSRLRSCADFDQTRPTLSHNRPTGPGPNLNRSRPFSISSALFLATRLGGTMGTPGTTSGNLWPLGCRGRRVYWSKRELPVSMPPWTRVLVRDMRRASVPCVCVCVSGGGPLSLSFSRIRSQGPQPKLAPSGKRRAPFHQLWNEFAQIVAPIHRRSALGLRRCGFDSGSLRGRFGVDLVSIYGRLVESMWGRSGPRHLGIDTSSQSGVDGGAKIPTQPRMGQPVQGPEGALFFGRPIIRPQTAKRIGYSARCSRGACGPQAEHRLGKGLGPSTKEERRASPNRVSTAAGGRNRRRFGRP